MDGSENSGIKYINYQVVLAEVSHRYTKAVLLESYGSMDWVNDLVYNKNNYVD